MGEGAIVDGGDGNGELVARGEHRGTLAYAGDRGEGTEGAAREMLVVDFPACENGPGVLCGSMRMEEELIIVDRMVHAAQMARNQ